MKLRLFLFLVLLIVCVNSLSNNNHYHNDDDDDSLLEYDNVLLDTTYDDDDALVEVNNDVVTLGQTGPKIKVSKKQIEEFKAAITKKKALTADKPYYTWTGFSHCLRWSLTGGINEGEMNYFTDAARDEKLSKAGAGVYFSGSRTSSSQFGYCLVEWTMPKGTPYYDESLATKIIGKGKKLNLRQKSELGKYVNFIDAYGIKWGGSAKDWHVAHNHQLFKKCKIVWEVVMERLHGTVLYQFFEELKALPKEIQHKVDKKTFDLWQHAAGYTYSLYTLMYYYDPISMLRAVNENTADPWKVFEPQNFGPFMKARSKMIRDILINKKDMNIAKPARPNFAGQEFTKHIFGGKTSDKTKWATEMTDKVLKGVYQAYSGTNIDYRNDFIRAGGDLFDKRFECTAEWADTMENNKVLEMHCKQNVKDGYVCYYYYPSADHCSRVVDLLSSKLKAQIKKNPKRGSNEYKTANKELMRELLIHYFKKHFGKQIAAHRQVKLWTKNGKHPEYFHTKGSSMNHAVQLMVDLISIHPMLDFNGRSTRGFVQAAAFESGLAAPVMLLYDMDIQLPPAKLAEFVELTTQAYESIQRNMVRVMIEKIQKGERVHLSNGYLDIHDGWMNLMTPLKVMGIDYPKKWSSDLSHLIYKRRWFKLFTHFGGTGWEKLTKAKASTKRFNEKIDQNLTPAQAVY